MHYLILCPREFVLQAKSAGGCISETYHLRVPAFLKKNTGKNQTGKSCLAQNLASLIDL